MGRRGEIMSSDNKGVLSFYSRDDVEKVINICNNLFYNNYAKTGILESNEQIKNRIKSEVEATYVDFFGKSHAEQIHQRLDGVSIDFAYSTQVGRNSIVKKFAEIKKNRFNEMYGTDFVLPETFSILSPLIGKQPLHFVQRFLPDTFESVQKQLDIDVDRLKDKDYSASVVAKIKDYAQKYDSMQYSDYAEVNENCKFVENFCEEVTHKTMAILYKKEIDKGEKDKAKILASINDSFYNNYGVSAVFDPVVCASIPDLVHRMAMLNPGFTLEAFVTTDLSKCIFGTSPSDTTILHELLHIVENSGFEKAHTQKKEYDNYRELRENEVFNEVVTDYFAEQMLKDRAKRNMPPIVNSKDGCSIYSSLFPLMEDFINIYKPELIETRLREYPAEEFARIIGEKEFSNIARLSNEILALNHDRTVIDISSMAGVKSVELFRTLKSVTNNQSRMRAIVMAVKRGGENFADKLREGGYPHLEGLTNAIYGASKLLGSLQQKHVHNKLDSPITAPSGASDWVDGSDKK